MRDHETAAAPILRRFKDLRDYTVGAVDGDIGAIEDVYFDDTMWTVRYVVVDTGTWLSGRKVLLSPAVLRGFDAPGRRVRTSLRRRQVKASPSTATAPLVSRQQEIALQTHYGYAPYWSGPYRWGAYAYPYPLFQPGVLRPSKRPGETGAAEEIAARERQNRDEHLRSAREVTGYGIRAIDGDLGHVEDLLFDEQDWAIRYLIVDPRNWWPGPHVLVGTDWIRAVSWDDSVVEVTVSRDAVRDAPQYEASRGFDRDDEMRLYAHHGRHGYWERRFEDSIHQPPAA